MSCPQQDVELYDGEDTILEVTMDPVTNITGWSFVFTLKTGYDERFSVFTQSTAAGEISITNPSGGVLQVYLLNRYTAQLEPRSYVYDVSRVDAGFEKVIATGNLVVKPRARN